jgi:hypothetical protein
MRSSAVRRFVLVAGVIGLLCVLTGCIKIDYALRVDPDDTLSGDLLFAMDREVLTADGKSEREVLEQFQKDADQQNAELPGVTRVQPYRKGGYLGQRVHFENVPFDEFVESQKDMAFRLRHEDDQYRFDAEFEPTKSSSDLEHLDRAVTASMRIRFAISFPGKVVETNGRIIGERTAVWRLDPQGRNQLYAVADDQPAADEIAASEPGGDTAADATAGSGGTPDVLWLALAGILVAAVLVGLVAGLLERRRA